MPVFFFLLVIEPPLQHRKDKLNQASNFFTALLTEFKSNFSFLIKPGEWKAYLTDIIVLKQGQQTNVTATGDAFQNGDIAIPRVQLYHIVENIGHSFASQKQVHQFLFGTCLK